jgi:uncharacterized membrane protein
MKHWDFHPTVTSGNERTMGERAADRMRMGMGSWTFVFVFLIFMMAWALINTTSTKWDPYPYILLNLLLSTLAGLQGAILLIAAKRADKIQAQLAEYHLEVSETTKQMLADHKQILEDLYRKL